MGRSRRIAVFSAALLVSVTTIVTIAISVDAIRDSVQFSRVLRRIERGDTSTATLLEAAEFARSLREWQTIMRIGWELESPQRWETVFALAGPAMRHFPNDPRWRYAAALAALRLNDAAAARDLLPLEPQDATADVKQFLRILADIDPEDRDRSLERLSAYRDLPEAYAILRATGEAETSPSPAHYRNAWDLTRVGAYGVNAALEGAATGDRAGVEALVAHVREEGALPPAERESAPLYLAVWLRDIDWLFEQLRSLSGTRAVHPEVLLIQGEGLVQQGRLEQARLFYRELQQVAPEYDQIAFLNDAAITHQLGDGDPRRILREGLRIHEGSILLRSELAGLLVAGNERLAAAQVLGPALVPRSSGDPRHRDWLLARAVLGPRRPLARLESDLWLYLNENPEATVVAQYLARFLARRGDETGMDRLRNRYDPSIAEWSTTLHLLRLRQEGNYSQAEMLLDLYPDDSWTARYNRVLFTVFHLPLPEIADTLSSFEDWLERGPQLSRSAYSQAQLAVLLARTEYQRLTGDTEGARETLSRATRLAPDDLNLSSYERLIAPPQ